MSKVRGSPARLTVTLVIYPASCCRFGMVCVPWQCPLGHKAPVPGGVTLLLKMCPMARSSGLLKVGLRGSLCKGTEWAGTTAPRPVPTLSIEVLSAAPHHGVTSCSSVPWQVACPHHCPRAGDSKLDGESKGKDGCCHLLSPTSVYSVSSPLGYEPNLGVLSQI